MQPSTIVLNSKSFANRPSAWSCGIGHTKDFCSVENAASSEPTSGSPVPRLRRPECRQVHLCDLARDITCFVEHDLSEAARSNGQLVPSEEGLTHWIVREMYAHSRGYGGSGLWVRQISRAEEARIGADLELWFWDKKTGRATGWLVQAKRLYQDKKRHPTPNFAALRHTVNNQSTRTRPLQASLLADAAKTSPGLHPMYWFYAWHDQDSPTCRSAPRCRCGPIGSDQALTVAHADPILRLLGQTKSNSWHTVIASGATGARTLIDFWCDQSGNSDIIGAIGNASRSMAYSPNGGRDADGLGDPIGRLPSYAAELVGDAITDDGTTRGEEASTTARSLSDGDTRHVNMDEVRPLTTR